MDDQGAAGRPVSIARQTCKRATHQPMSTHRLVRMPTLDQIFDWFNAKMDMPTSNYRWSQFSAWDYAEVDHQEDWDAEPHPERLEDAFRSLEESSEARFGALMDLALAGSVIAMNAVGECYYWGRGVPMDAVRGEEWFRKSLEQGSRRALLNYGKALYWRNEPELAEAIFRGGAGQDLAPALYWLAKLLLERAKNRDIKREACQLLERAAAKGSPAAKWRLSRDMARGGFGLRKIPRGHVLLRAYARETLDEWNRRSKASTGTPTSHEATH